MTITTKEKMKIWSEFLDRWPKTKLDDIKLSEYVDVNNKDTFAYWLEHKTLSLGSIRGGSSDKFGIYRRNNPPKGSKSHIIHGDDYSWLKRLGSDKDEAFNNVKNCILEVIHAVSTGFVEAIETIELSDTLKWKIAFLYQDRNNPIVLNVFKKSVLQNACNQSSDKISELYNKIMKSRNNLNVIDYGFKIWTEFGDEASHNETQIEPSIIESSSLNTILYGPPGTGKTYNTINKALEIIDPKFLSENNSDDKREFLKKRFDELVDTNRIGFVTFHQSFSYEDFVEGIKASTDDKGQVSYDIEDGIFKRMCSSASSKVTKQEVGESIDVSHRNIWKMSLGNTLGNDAYIYDLCIANNYITLGYGDQIDFSTANNRQDVADLFKSNGYTSKNEKFDYGITSVNNFKNDMLIGDLVIISDGNYKFRAIAEITDNYYFDNTDNNTDGEYCQCRKVKWLNVFSPSLPKEEIFNNNLSQMTLYRLRPPTIDLLKFQALMNSKISVSNDALKANDFVSNYQVLSISDDLIELKKPNKAILPIGRSIINELINLVSTSKITVDDIKNKQVFEKVESNLEKYIVNGYPNVLAPLVEKILADGIVANNLPESERRVLIIDEINRGNIANIFGELITLIEPSKRASGDESLSVILPYSKKSFSVPSNLFLIGTMNTADKSLAQVDIALRRRFDFTEMMPDYSVLDDIEPIDGIDIARMLETINQRIELLYDREHTIGHSFFLPLKSNATLDKLAEIFELQILPLMEEYFFEDWERVGQVLGDHLKYDSKLRFIKEKFNSKSISVLMGEDWEQDTILPFERNINALSMPEAYIGIYEPQSN